MQVFYETSARLGLKADFPQGPNQGAGVPMASPNQVGSSVGAMTERCDNLDGSC